MWKANSLVPDLNSGRWFHNHNRYARLLSNSSSSSSSMHAINAIVIILIAVITAINILIYICIALTLLVKKKWSDNRNIIFIITNVFLIINNEVNHLNDIMMWRFNEACRM